MANFFINCDWGTTHFRLRLVTTEPATVAAEFCSDQGVAAIALRTDAANRPAGFRTVLAEGLRRLRQQSPEPVGPVPILISGMAGSSIGWQELPYARVPWHLDGSDMTWRELEPIQCAGTSAGDGAHRAILLSGVRTPHDVMRGEETQALGLFQLDMARRLSEHSIVVMPGTHSKHLRVESGAIADFQTFMTGELFDVLGRHSILRHSIGAEQVEVEQPSGARQTAFLAGARGASELPLSAALFRVRARDVLDSVGLDTNRAYLSGVLIGSELAYLRQPQHDAMPIALCAAAPLADLYRAACEAIGLEPRLCVVDAADVSRLSALGQALLLPRLSLA